MLYEDDEKKEIVPDTEVSIADFTIAVMIAFLLSLMLVWWWIPCVWIYQNIKRESINNLLYKKRFKCKGK